VPEEEPGYEQTDRVDHAANNHEAEDVIPDAMPYIVVFKQVVDKIGHVRFSLEEVRLYLDWDKYLA
jgi:hypothetical protein